MSRRTLTLWGWFLAAHALVIVLGWTLPSQPMGDVYNVYEPWSSQALIGGPIVGVTEPWVYPQLALVPMIAAWAFAWIAGYTFGWAVLITLLNGLVFALIVHGGKAPWRARAALTWVAFIACLGPVGMFRIDAVTVPLAIIALLLAFRVPTVSSALLTAGAWIKIWPAALVGALVVARRGTRVRVVGAALGVTVVVIATLFALGGAGNVFGFLSSQFGRGLQVESTAATPFTWLAALHVDGFHVAYNADIITFEVTGPGVTVVAALLTPLLAIAALAVLALGAWKSVRGAHLVQLLPPLALALVLVLIVTNKVGSPQFLDWIIAPFVLWAAADGTTLRSGLRLGGAALLLTQLIYPIIYDLIWSSHPLGILVLSVRNVLLVTLLVWSVRRVVRVPARGRHERAPVTLASSRPPRPRSAG